MTIHYEPHEMKLANEIASTLHDEHSLPLHLQFVRRYTESFLRRMLEQALAVPKDKLRKSRAALYVYLVSKDDKSSGPKETAEPEHTSQCPTCGREYDYDRHGY